MKLKETWGYKNEAEEKITDPQAVKSNIYFLDAILAGNTFCT